jgi:hypothetical protein
LRALQARIRGASPALTNALAVAIDDGFPVAAGHMMIVPRRHAAHRALGGAVGAFRAAGAGGGTPWDAAVEEVRGVARGIYLRLPEDALLWAAGGGFDRPDVEGLRRALM